eukprot:10276624-Alexandrium_andersonii.AAC.1
MPPTPLGDLLLHLCQSCVGRRTCHGAFNEVSEVWDQIVVRCWNSFEGVQMNASDMGGCVLGEMVGGCRGLR